MVKRKTGKKRRPVRHKTDAYRAGDYSTRCGLWIHESQTGRIAETWRGVTCLSCLRCGNRRKR